MISDSALRSDDIKSNLNQCTYYNRDMARQPMKIGSPTSTLSIGGRENLFPSLLAMFYNWFLTREDCDLEE